MQIPTVANSQMDNQTPEPLALNDLQRAVLRVISQHSVPNERILRGELLLMINAELQTDYSTDRAIRDAIEFLRANHKDGAFISASFPSEGEAGYFLARNEVEARLYMRPDWERYNNLGTRLNSQTNLLDGQETMSPAQIGML